MFQISSYPNPQTAFYFTAILLALPVVQCQPANPIDCAKECGNPDYTNPNYRPQFCAKHCPPGK